MNISQDLAKVLRQLHRVDEDLIREEGSIFLDLLVGKLQEVLFFDPLIEQDLKYIFIDLRNLIRNTIQFTLLMDLVEERLFALISFDVDVHQILDMHVNVVVIEVDFLHAVLKLRTILVLELLETVFRMQLLDLILLANIFIQILIELKVAGNQVRVVSTLVVDDLADNVFAF